jgi:hypothetical protein
MNITNKKTKANFASTIAVSIPTDQLDPFPPLYRQQQSGFYVPFKIRLMLIPKMDRSHTLMASAKNEEATRQQGGLFSRENSSNGGKAIRTFWRNTKFGKNRCQGLIDVPISHYLGVSYELPFSLITPTKFVLYSLFAGTIAFKQLCNQRLSFAAAPG